MTGYTTCHTLDRLTRVPGAAPPLVSDPWKFSPLSNSRSTLRSLRVNFARSTLFGFVFACLPLPLNWSSPSRFLVSVLPSPYGFWSSGGFTYSKYSFLIIWSFSGLKIWVCSSFSNSLSIGVTWSKSTLDSRGIKITFKFISCSMAIWGWALEGAMSSWSFISNHCPRPVSISFHCSRIPLLYYFTTSWICSMFFGSVSEM